MIFAKTIDGGTGTYLTKLLKLKNLLENKLTLVVVALEEPIYMQSSNENISFMKRRDYSFQKYSLSYRDISNFIKESFWVSKKIWKEKPDIILTIDINCNIHVGLIRFFSKKNFKTIFTTHSDLSGNLNQKSSKTVQVFLKRIINFLYNRSDLNICVSNELSLNLRTSFNIKSRIKTIYNGLDHINTAERDGISNSRRILMVARLDDQKDHLTLLKAFELVTKEIRNTHLWIVGDGPLKKDLESYVNEYHLEKNVKFFGWERDINKFFINSDIFVLSSNREGFPYALIEAMSFGLPVVCTNTPYGPKEILDDGKYGFLVPMKAYTEMKDAIIKLLNDRDTYLKYSHLSAQRSRLFTSERMVSEYANEIERFL
jgi:glycosyltransferase involved in cell wall biosynthesis